MKCKMNSLGYKAACTNNVTQHITQMHAGNQKRFYLAFKSQH